MSWRTPKSLPPKVFSPNPIARVSTIDVETPKKIIVPGDITVYARLKYRGDRIPWVTNFIKGKGDKTGNYLLPAYHMEDGEIKWMDVPGPTDADYTVIRVEKKTTKTGKPAPDLIHLRCSSFSPNITVALRREDIVAKFDALFIPDIFRPAELNPAEALKIESDRVKWQNEIQQGGW